MLRDHQKGVVIKSYDLVEEEFGGVGMNCGGKIDVAIEIVEPEPHLIIAGSGHMSTAIAKLAHILGFEVVVIDPLAKKDNFPDARQVISDFIETNLINIQVSSNTYIVIVTRHKDDLPAVRAALKTGAGYIGLIGSRRRVLQTYRILLKGGFTAEEIGRINAPIGLNIGAETPDEIAVSIMAEIIQRRRLGLTKTAEPKKIGFDSIQSIAQGAESAEQSAEQSSSVIPR
jgi:xanthine dehydrogenase accessory factor